MVKKYYPADPDPDFKTCPYCGVRKNRNDYYPNKKGPKGMQVYCKPCISVKNKDNHNKNKEDRNVRARSWHEANKEHAHATEKARRLANPELTLWRLARTRAQRQGTEFNIEVSDIVIPVVCPALGIPIIYNPMKDVRPDSSPTIDRVDTTRGYLKGNVQVISMRANRLKADMDEDTLRKMIAYVEENIGK